MTFTELGLHPSILEALHLKGFENPMPIQEQAIPILLQGHTDMVGLAQTGTGKTAAFSLPIIHLILHEPERKKRTPLALIVCPTRELCMQIVSEIEGFTAKTRNIKCVAVYGGASISGQIKDITRGVDIVVATPGRLIDLVERKAIQLSEIQWVVLDEADEMLNMGFQEDIEFILQQAENRRSTWLFSATMPPEIRKVSKRYMEDPKEISIGRVNTANTNIDHQFCLTHHNHRYETLKRIIDFNPGMYGLIFTRTKMDAQNITEKLVREGYDVDSLHGDLSQPQRDKVMNAFRHKALTLLIATDVAARGIDVTGITHVINYELPDDAEVYTHRSGRTARAGATGVCISIVSPAEQRKLKYIESQNKVTLKRLEIPSGRDVCRKQFYHFIDKLTMADISSGEYETYMPMLIERFADMSKEELAKRVAALEFDRFLKYYENAEDLNIHGSDKTGKGRRDKQDGRSDRGDRGSFGNPADYTKLFVNIGSKDGFYKASLLQFVLDMSDLKKSVLGKVDLKDIKSIIEVEKASAKKMINAIDGKTYKGRKIRMNPL